MDWIESTVIETEKLAEEFIKISLKLPEEVNCIAGQHVDIRLTAPDGYQAQRSYSLYNSGGVTDSIEIVVEVIENGEVSSFLDSIEVGEKIEIKGPIGGHFIYTDDLKNILLIGGGSGIVPLIAIHKSAKSMSNVEVKLIASVRSQDRLFFAEFYNQYQKEIDLHITREKAESLGQLKDDMMISFSRISTESLQKSLNNDTRKYDCIYVCGRNAFVEGVTESLNHLGIDPKLIKTERFG